MFRKTQSDGEKVVSKKLVPTLWDKEEYVVHYRNLQFYLKQGMVLKKTHRVIAFTQDAWLKPYIQYNTNMRKKASNKFDVRLYKAYNNIVFGKTMENIRLHMNFNLVNTRKGLLRLTSKPSFERITIFDQQLVGVKNRRVKLVLDKPIYTGMCVLDLSKLFMYQFHYGFIKKKYGDRACLLMTDTDSLFYSIKTTDMYKDMQENSDLFDTSEYPKNHFLYSENNKKVVGKMKDETNGDPVTTFVGLRAKMYSFQTKHGLNVRKAKGVTKSVRDQDIDHQDYIDCLFNKEISRNVMESIRSDKHVLYLKAINKVSLSPYDDKRWVCDDGITTYAYGDYRINNS